MKINNKGFILIESIISLSIISLATYIISAVLYNSSNIVSKNSEKIAMLNIAKSSLENLKYDIKNNKINNLNNIIENKYGYDVIKNIEKEEKYYQCYKVNIEVKNDIESINLISYVSK